MFPQNYIRRMCLTFNHSNGSPLFGFSMVFYLNKMVAILSKPIGNPNGTIALAIVMTDHSNTKALKIRA